MLSPCVQTGRPSYWRWWSPTLVPLWVVRLDAGMGIESSHLFAHVRPCFPSVPCPHTVYSKPLSKLLEEVTSFFLFTLAILLFMSFCMHVLLSATQHWRPLATMKSRLLCGKMGRNTNCPVSPFVAPCVGSSMSSSTTWPATTAFSMSAWLHCTSVSQQNKPVTLTGTWCARWHWKLVSSSLMPSVVWGFLTQRLQISPSEICLVSQSENSNCSVC